MLPPRSPERAPAVLRPSARMGRAAPGGRRCAPSSRHRAPLPWRNKCRHRLRLRSVARHSGSCPTARRPAPMLREEAGARGAHHRSALVPPPPEESSLVARCGGLLARGRRPRRLPSRTPGQWSLPRTRRLQLRGQRRHYTGLPCRIAKATLTHPRSGVFGLISTGQRVRLRSPGGASRNSARRRGE